MLLSNILRRLMMALAALVGFAVCIPIALCVCLCRILFRPAGRGGPGSAGSI